MAQSAEVECVLRFVAAINDHDPDRIAELMTDDHMFVDSLDSARTGKKDMWRAWNQYMAMFPDYRIHVEETFQNRELVGLFGRATGTWAVDGELLEENRFDVPAAWKAVVRDGKVKHWQVYADNDPVRRIIDAASAPPEDLFE
jgi:ketosteroid isomerase-like protein